MELVATIRELYRHMEWADAEVWRAAVALPAVANDEKFAKLIHHTHMVQRAFLSLWEQTPPEFTRLESFEGFRALEEWGRTYHALATFYLDSLEETHLDRLVSQPWAEEIAKYLGRPPETPTLGETLLQVALHSLYHRGQLNIRIRDLGGEPPLVDFIAWIWAGRPAPQWPEPVASTP